MRLLGHGFVRKPQRYPAAAEADEAQPADALATDARGYPGRLSLKSRLLRTQVGARGLGLVEAEGGAR